MKLLGKQLTVVNIHRKGIFDMDSLAFCCDNCGRTIVNSATVKDEEGKIFVIGLDCKKTLIDKKVFEKIQSQEMDYLAKHKIKELKREYSDLQKVMMYIDNSDRYEVRVSQFGSYQDLIVYDKTKQGPFGDMGLNIFSESVPYLFKIGLKDVLLNAVQKGIITKI